MLLLLHHFIFSSLFSLLLSYTCNNINEYTIACHTAIKITTIAIKVCCFCKLFYLSALSIAASGRQKQQQSKSVDLKTTPYSIVEPLPLPRRTPICLRQMLIFKHLLQNNSLACLLFTLSLFLWAFRLFALCGNSYFSAFFMCFFALVRN